MNITEDHLFELICDEFDGNELCPSEEKFNSIITDLCECEDPFLEKHPLNCDQICYSARNDLKWNDFQHLSCPIKKRILFHLVNNPKTFFVLMNTQKGKSAIIVKHLTTLTQTNKNERKKIISIVFLDNDRTLAEQSKDSINGVPDSKIYQLSSNCKVNPADVIMHIDAWVNDNYDDYKTPIIMSLPNATQLRKIVDILRQVLSRVNTRGWQLVVCILIDECDKVYPLIRDPLLPFIQCDQLLYKLGFVSATDADMFDDYPECANAYFESHSDESLDYRAFHHPDSVIHIVDNSPKKHNQFAYKVIEENPSHFSEPKTLQNGMLYYPKIIVNGDLTRSSMESFANKVTARDSFEAGKNYCITINMTGLKLFKDGKQTIAVSIRGQRLNDVLYWMYKSQQLDDKPLYVIGNRKVDRGLGFHFAPRKDDSGQFICKSIELKGISVVSENGDGLIFTDLILGRVERVETGVQKAGRCAGIIGQSPNYCGKVHYWTDKKTAEYIRLHNRKVDHMNDLPGAYTAQQADVRSREILAQEPRPPVDKKFKTSIDGEGGNQFNTAAAAKEWFLGLRKTRLVCPRGGENKEPRQELYTTSEYKMHSYNESGELTQCKDGESGTHIKYRGEPREIMTLDEFTQSTDVGWGLDCARIMPVRTANNNIEYVVIWK